jgi:catechol 2,3-dioxygenase-like lactoylglutathione lyase family enzyme
LSSQTPESALASSIHHVAVIVRDVESSKRFYLSVFGFQEIERLTARVSSHKGAWFRVGQLELHLQQREEPVDKTEQHFALVTERFDEVVTRTKEFGGAIEEAKLVEGFTRRCFLYDPDRNRIELLQR